MQSKSFRGSWQSFLSSGRVAQAGWLLYMIISLSLALPGLDRYHEALQSVCTGNGCLSGQLTPIEAQAVSKGGEGLAEYASIVFIIYLFSDAFLLLTAGILIWRKPGHPAAICGAFLFVTVAVVPLADVSLAAVTPGLPAGQILRFIQLSLLLPVLALIPDGQFHPSWLRWIVLALLPAAALISFDLSNSAVSLAVQIIISVSIIGSLLFRWLVDKQHQEPVMWTLAAVTLLACEQWLGQPVQWLFLPRLPISYIQVINASPYPVYGMLLLVGGLTCLSIALLGDELFRVDVVLSRAIVYSFLSLFVVGSYVLIVGYLSMIFQSSGNLWLSLVATGIVAAFFHPIREWVQRFVNRMIYGERDDPYTVITQLGLRLETLIASDEVIPTILHTVREALKVTYAMICLYQKGDGKFVMVADDGQLTPIVLTLPLVYQNETVGQLQLSPRAGENNFSRTDRRLLDDLARQAGAAIHAAGLNADLQSARERLVIAQEEERRRIRRDLHDGLGASLAVLNLQAGEVQRLINSDPETANQKISDVRAGIRTAIADIRRLVYGLRPPALDELGLIDALRGRTAQHQSSVVALTNIGLEDNSPSPQICLEAPDSLPPLPAAVEVAVYRIVEEALANVAHHAQAKNCFIQLVLENAGIQIEIRDDGIGLPEVYRPGIGLISMRERAAELGGNWTIQSEPGKGVQVRAWLPILSTTQSEKGE